MRTAWFKTKTIDAYNRIALDYKVNKPKLLYGDELRFFKRLIKGKRVIEFGCGFGREAKFFVKNGFDYLGIDASQTMVKLAKKQVKSARFLVSDFLKLKFPPKSFDGFWAAASFLHIPKNKIGRLLNSVRVILKDDGIGFISLKERKSISEGFISQREYGKSFQRFFTFYDEDEFKRLLEKNGFKVTKHYSVTKRYLEGKKKWLCYFVRKI